jgi:hypothetical protein
MLLETFETFPNFRGVRVAFGTRQSVVLRRETASRACLAPTRNPSQYESHSFPIGAHPLACGVSLSRRAVVLSENQCCPFTKQKLQRSQITALNVNNIERFRDKMVSV